MAATPAWPPKSTPRLFVEPLLSEGMDVPIGGASANYLLAVMRLKLGDPVKLFDDQSGEYLALVSAVGKRDLVLSVEGKLREREEAPDLWLCAAPIKRARFDWMAEKACELGVRRFVPVLTARAVVDKVKDDRLRSHMIEAAEQCERTALPELGEMVRLDRMLSQWPADRVLFFCDERLHESNAVSFQEALAHSPGPAGILIGPEGGFSDSENAAIRSHPMAVPVSLGPRILRSDTAALAAISVWMAGSGNWA